MSEVLTGISGEIQRFLQRVGNYDAEKGFIKEFEKNNADLSEEIDNTADFSFPENFDDNLAGWTNAISDYWNSSVKECLDKIILSYDNMKDEDTYKSPNRDAGNSFGEGGNEEWVKPNLNKEGQTYANARSDELIEVLKNNENLDFTEGNISEYFTRLLMPQYKRRVEVEDLNRNFWVIGQAIQALSDFAFGNGSPLDMTIKSLISELVGIWDNVYRIWQSIFRLAKKIDELQKQVNDLSAGTQKTGTTINLGLVWGQNKSFWDFLFKWVNVKKQDEEEFVDLTYNSNGFPLEHRQYFQYYFFGTERTIEAEETEHWIFRDNQEIINQGYSWIYETEDKIIYDSYDENQSFQEELFLPGYNGFLYNHTTTKEILNEMKEKAGAYKVEQLIDRFKEAFPVKLSSISEDIREAEAIKDNLALISVRAPRLGCIVKYPQIDINGNLIRDNNQNIKYFYMAWDLAHPLSTYDIIHSNDTEIENFKGCITNYKENKEYLSVIDEWNTKAFDMFNYANWVKGGHTEFVLNRSIYEGLNFEYDLDENKNIQSTNMISSNILDAKVNGFKFIEYKRSSTGADAREMAKVLFDISKLNLVARCYQKGHNLSYEYATPWDFIPALFEPIEDDYWNDAMECAWNTFVAPSTCTPVDLTLFFKLPIFKKYYYINNTAKNLLECYDNFKNDGTPFPTDILNDIVKTIQFIQEKGLNKIIKIFGKKIKCCSNPTIYTTTANNDGMLNGLFLKTNENNEKVSFFKNVQPINWGWTATLLRDFDMCNTMDWDEQCRQFGEENTPNSAYADIDQGIIVPYLNKRFEYEDYSGKIKLQSHQGGIEADNGHKDRMEIMLEDGFMQGMRIAAENFDNTLETVVSVGEGGLRYSQDKRDYDIDYLANYLIPNIGGDIRGYGFQFDVSPYDRHFKQAIISFDFRGVNTGNLIYGAGVDIIQFSNSSISVNYNLSNTKDKGKNALLQDVFRINEPMPISVPRDDCSQYTVKQLVESEQEDKTNPYLFRYYSMKKTYTDTTEREHIYKLLVDGQLGLYNVNLYKPLKTLSVNRIEQYNTGNLPTVINENNVAIFSPNALTNYYLTQFSKLNNIFSPALRNTAGVINMNSIKLGTTYPSLPYYKIFDGENYVIQKYEEYNTMKITDIYGEANERYVNPALYFDVENIFTGWASLLVLFPKFIKEELAPLAKDWITASEGKISSFLEAPVTDENGVIIRLMLYNGDDIIGNSSLKKTLTELSKNTDYFKTTLSEEAIYFPNIIEDFKKTKDNIIEGEVEFITLGKVQCNIAPIIESTDEKQKLYLLSFNLGDEDNKYGEAYSGIIIKNLETTTDEEIYTYKTLRLNGYNKFFTNDIRCNLFKNDSDVPVINEKTFKNIISDFIIENEFNKYYAYDVESGKLTIYFGAKYYYNSDGSPVELNVNELSPIYELNNVINDCMWIYKLEIFGFNDTYEVKEGDNSNEDYNYLTAQWIVNEDNIFNKTKRAYYTESDSPLPTLDDFINAENEEEKNAIKPVDYLSWFGFQYLNNGT